MLFIIKYFECMFINTLPYNNGLGSKMWWYKGENACFNKGMFTTHCNYTSNPSEDTFNRVLNTAMGICAHSYCKNVTSSAIDCRCGFVSIALMHPTNVLWGLGHNYEHVRDDIFTSIPWYNCLIKAAMTWALSSWK